jgi:hypothetical protein
MSIEPVSHLANRLETQLADYNFTMSSHIATVAALEAFGRGSVAC